MTGRQLLPAGWPQSALGWEMVLCMEHAQLGGRSFGQG